MFKKIFKTHSIIKTLCALVLGSSLSISALADGATETVGYSTFQAVVTHGSNDTIGSPTSFRAGDTIQWAGVYSAPVIDYPQWKEHTILFPSGQPYEAGKTYAMYGYTTVYKVNGGWTTAQAYRRTATPTPGPHRQAGAKCPDPEHRGTGFTRPQGLPPGG